MLELKETIEILEGLLCIWKLQPSTKETKALELAIFHLELLSKVEKGGVEKRKIEYFCVCDCIPCKTGHCDKCELEYADMKPGDLCKEGDDSYEVEAFNSAIDACNAHWVKKLDIDKLQDVFVKMGCSVARARQYAQSIISHLTGGKG